MRERGISFLAPSRAEVNYSQFAVLRDFLDKHRPEFVINSAGFTGKPNVDACEANWADTLQGNTLFPVAVAQACASLDIPCGHVSSGCIYSGAKVVINGQTRVERDLANPPMQALLKKNRGVFHGFTEEDEPNFTFRRLPCSFYSGTKALAEESMRGVGRGYIWRLRIPFDRFDSPRNYLSKLQNYPKVYENANSLSHRADFVAACLDLWQRKAPFGTYNVTNPGFVTSRQVVEMIQKILHPPRAFDFWASDEEFYHTAAKTPRSNCILDVTKIISAGIKLRAVEEALTDSLKNWAPLK
jgi:dTDP-4-dehydrorhamnose reductase